MSGELDEKGRDAALAAWWDADPGPTDTSYRDAMDAAIRAYLAASASPSEMEVVANLRSDAAQLLRMSKATAFGEDLSVRVAKPDLLIANMVAAADTVEALSAQVPRLTEEVEALRKGTERDNKIIGDLQAALAYWMPSVRPDTDEGLPRSAGDDAMLLFGHEGPEQGCWGDDMLARIKALVEARERSLNALELLDKELTDHGYAQVGTLRATLGTARSALKENAL